MKIAVTGVGGGVGQSILKSLKETDYQVIPLDADPLAAGLYYGMENGHVIPYARDEQFITQLIEICKKEKIALLFPGMDAELMKLSVNREKFREVGTQVIVSRPEIIDIADNKLLTYKKLTALGINVPKTIDLTDFSSEELSFPFIIKQKIGGARSNNVFVIENEVAFDNFLNIHNKSMDKFVAQEYLAGDEYTCGSVTLDGACNGVIVMRRILRNGDTYKSFSERNLVIEDFVKEICNKIEPFGACNVQLRLNNGVPFVFEINARCSGTTASRSLCGFNEPKMIADKILKNIQPSFKIKEMTVLRYWEEIIVENSKIVK